MGHVRGRLAQGVADAFLPLEHSAERIAASAYELVAKMIDAQHRGRFDGEAEAAIRHAEQAAAAAGEARHRLRLTHVSLASVRDTHQIAAFGDCDEGTKPTFTFSTTGAAAATPPAA